MGFIRVQLKETPQLAFSFLFFSFSSVLCSDLRRGIAAKLTFNKTVPEGK